MRNFYKVGGASNGIRSGNFLLYRKPPACGICDDSLCVVSAKKSQARCLNYFKCLRLAPLGGASFVYPKDELKINIESKSRDAMHVVSTRGFSAGDLRAGIFSLRRKTFFKVEYVFKD